MSVLVECLGTSERDGQRADRNVELNRRLSVWRHVERAEQERSSAWEKRGPDDCHGDILRPEGHEETGTVHSGP